MEQAVELCLRAGVERVASDFKDVGHGFPFSVLTVNKVHAAARSQS
jgi:hypothetical protein